MAGYSARQATYTSGDTITAAHSNDEFNQLLAAFNASTGHTHDGTAGDGGPVTTLRDSDALNKILVDTSNNHLEFYVEVSSAAVQQLRIQDGAIVPITDNDIDLGTSSLEFKDLYVDGTAHVDAINFNGTAITSTAAELNILDGVTSTATELNIIDGDTSATSTTVADADRVVFNDAGTMKQVAVTDLAAYFDDEITAMPNLVTTAATTVGALNSGSITSGFGTIDTGSSTITTTGLITGGSLDIDDVLINGSNIGHTDDTDLLTIASGILTVAGEVSMTTLDIGGTNVTSTAAELNLVDGITAGTVSASLAVIADSNKDISGFRNVTLTGELDAGSLDISGDADIDGTLEADAITVNGATLTEFITDAVGGMVSSNTETGISVTFEDGDNTLDFALGSSQTTISSLTNTSLVIGRDADNDIDFATDNNIIFRAAGADQIKLVDGALAPVTDNDIDLGTSSLEFKDAFFDGTVTADAFAGPLTGDVTGNVSGTAATVTGAAQSNITSLGTLTTLTVDDITINGSTISDADNFTIDCNADINLDANGADINFKDDGTQFGGVSSNSGNLIIKSGTTTALTFSGANVTVAGDLTISGDDITMGTNTDTAIMVADGTNFNPVVPSGDVTLTNAGVFGIASGAIVNADVNASAAIADSKLDTISTANKVSLAALDIDGGTDIGEAIVDADLFIVDNGAGGTNRKMAASRLLTYVDANSSAASVGKAIAMAIVFG